MVAAAVDPLAQVYAEPLAPQPVAARAIPIRQSPRLMGLIDYNGSLQVHRALLKFLLQA